MEEFSEPFRFEKLGNDFSFSTSCLKQKKGVDYK